MTPMRSLAALALFLVLGPVLLAAQPQEARLSGTVRDSSGSILPGVTVAIGPEHGDALASVTTDSEGRYAFAALPPGVFIVSFELSGFATRSERVVLKAGDPVGIDALLRVGAMQEIVTVVAEPSQPEPIVAVPQARPLPEPQPVVEHASVCGPREAESMGEPVGRVTAVEIDPRRVVLGDRDVLVIDRGTADGVTVGRNFVVRRPTVIERSSGRTTLKWSAEFTAALVQVVEADEHSAMARPLYVCHEISIGDRLDPFEAQPLVRATHAGTPDLEAAGRVVFGNEGRSMAAVSEFMVIDRGARHGAHPGQWVTMMRGVPGRSRASVIGNALVVAVQNNSATIRIQSAREAIEIGDMAVLHR